MLPENYIGLPIRSLQTMLRVLAAVDARYQTVVPDGIYGEKTASAVSQFQRLNALPVTAQTDQNTWNRIVDAFLRQGAVVLPAAPLSIVWQPRQTIRPGQRNGHLFLIQSMFLALRRFYPAMPEAAVTGTHDAPSVEATKWLQGKSGLSPDGVIDQTTWLYLTSLYSITAGDGTQGVNGSGMTGDSAPPPAPQGSAFQQSAYFAPDTGAVYG